MIWKQKLNTIPAKVHHRSCTGTTFTLRTPARKTPRLDLNASQEDYFKTSPCSYTEERAHILGSWH